MIKIIFNQADLFLEPSGALLPARARATMLAACADPPPSTPRLDCSSLGKTTSGFGAGPDRRAIFDFLCPGLLAMERAPCESLRSVKALAALLTPVSQAPLCCKLGWSGIRHSPHDLAAVLIALAGGHEQAPMPLSAARGGRVRLATIASGPIIQFVRLHF